MIPCSTCRRVNEADARYCSGCGAELAAPSVHEVRKMVTVLFADVAGSTALGERLDPEALRRVMARYFAVARRAIEHHGGTVEKFIGDAVMAVFGVPTVHEDDALRALRAAAELREALGTLGEELERDMGVSLHARIGVNTGEVVTGTEERLATGDAVNVAARLEQAAQPDEILVGEPTVRLARGAIEVAELEPLALKGKTDPVRAWRLLRVIDGASAIDRRLDTALVGRGAELARLRAAFERAVSERRCRLVTLLGPPGIGKSRLMRELEAIVAGEATVLAGRCLPYGEGITYWPLIEIFRAAGAEDELATALRAGTSEEIAWSVRKALERRARERPIALVVEDIHWAEPTLLDLLEHLVVWAHDAPILLVCLARPELVESRPSWGTGPSSESLTLEPLSPTESDELIGGLLRRSRISVHARARVNAVAEGNPLFVEQLVAMLAEGGQPDLVPASIQALLAARVDALPLEERSVLERASVVGLEFEWEALGELAPDRRRPGGAQLTALVRRDLVQPHEGIEDAFRFRHMLIRDAAYERIPKEVRSELHERCALWLDGRGEEIAEVVAYHYEQAHRCLVNLGRHTERTRALAEAAAERLGAAARRAEARGDSRATLNLLERTIALLPADDVRRVRLLPTLGRELREAGDLDRADVVLSEAVERASALGERGIAADAGVSRSDLRLHRTVQTGVTRADVRRDVDEAVRVFDALGDRAGLARALTLGGKLRYWGGEAAAALAEFARAATLAHEAGARPQETEALLGETAAMREGPMPTGDAMDRIASIARSVGANRRLELGLLMASSSIAAMQGRFDEARESIARAEASAQELGLVNLLQTRIRLDAGVIELLAGDQPAAERLLRPAAEAAERLGEPGALSSVAPHLADAVYRQGRAEEALLVTERWRPERLTVPEDVDAQIGWRRVRAKVLARLGDYAEAERLAREAVEIGARTDYLAARAWALADLAEVLESVGRREESEAALREARALFEAKGHVAGLARLRGLASEAPDGN